MSLLVPLLEAMRPHQWVKNLFIFAALVFGKRLDDAGAVIAALLAFVAFCLVASAVYIWNDICDVEQDRQHPSKRMRPIASGTLSVRSARVAMFVLLAVSAAITVLVERTAPLFFLCPLAYFLNNLLYSWRLKHVVLLDAFSIAAGFVLRVYAGGEAIGTPISEWLLLCTMFVSLFLALCKRRAELNLLKERSEDHRAILAEYSEYFLDQLIALLTACTILSYAVYSVHPKTQQTVASGLHWSVPFVVYGVCRYLYLVHRRDQGGNPTRAMLKDPPFMLNGILWTASIIAAIYLKALGV